MESSARQHSLDAAPATSLVASADTFHDEEVVSDNEEVVPEQRSLDYAAPYPKQVSEEQWMREVEEVAKAEQVIRRGIAKRRRLRDPELSSASADAEPNPAPADAEPSPPATKRARHGAPPTRVRPPALGPAFAVRPPATDVERRLQRIRDSRPGLNRTPPLLSVTAIDTPEPAVALADVSAAFSPPASPAMRQHSAGAATDAGAATATTTQHHSTTTMQEPATGQLVEWDQLASGLTDVVRRSEAQLRAAISDGTEADLVQEGREIERQENRDMRKRRQDGLRDQELAMQI